MRFFKSRKNTEEKIKEATFELLSTKGYSQVSMRDIAKKAKTALGQLTYYYGTKEKLIMSVFDEMSESFVSEMKRYIEKSSDKVSGIVSFFEDIYDSEDKLYRVLIDFSAQSLWNDKLREKTKALFERLTFTIESAYEECGVDKNEAEMKAKLYISNIYGAAVQKIMANGDSSIDKAIDYQKSMFKKERMLRSAKPSTIL